MPESETMIQKKIDFFIMNQINRWNDQTPITKKYENVFLELRIGQSFHFSALSNLQIISHAPTNTPGN